MRRPSRRGGSAPAWLTLAVLLVGCSQPSRMRAPDDGGSSRDGAGDARADSGTDAAPPPPGTVRTVGPCDPGSIPGTTCTRLSIACPGLSDLAVDVRVTTPPAGAAKAVIVLGTGGGGQGFFEGSPPGAGLVTELAGGGFVVAQRKWDAPGWFQGGAGVRASSCRYATLLRWVDQTLHPPSVPLCALGSSGGAIEIAYGLARWDAADRLGGAILLGGPSMSRLDVVCPSVAPASWLDGDCRSLATRYGLTCPDSLYCTLQGAAGVVDTAWAPQHPCTDPQDPDVPALAGDGVLAPDSHLSYPQTKVRLLLGGDECSAAVLLYYDAITSDHVLQVVPGTPHNVTATDAGLAATRDAIRSACAQY